MTERTMAMTLEDYEQELWRGIFALAFGLKKLRFNSLYREFTAHVLNITRLPWMEPVGEDYPGIEDPPRRRIVALMILLDNMETLLGQDEPVPLKKLRLQHLSVACSNVAREAYWIFLDIRALDAAVVTVDCGHVHVSVLDLERRITELQSFLEALDTPA